MLLKPTYCLTVALLFISFSSLGQSRDNQVSLSFGPSLPMGDFASDAQNNEAAGYANVGLSVRLVYRKNISEQAGFVVTTFGQLNNFKTEKLATQLKEASSGGADSFNWTVKKAAWKMAGVLPGLSYTLALTNDQSICLNSIAKFGAVFAKSPLIEAEGKSTNAYAISRQSDAQSWGTAAAIASGLSYRFSPAFSVLADVEYMTTSQLTFKDVYVLSAATNGGLAIPGLYEINNSVNPPTTVEGVGDFKQRLNSLNVRVGISISF